MALHTFVATTTRGAEAALAAELRGLGARRLTEDRGAVRFDDRLEDGYRICLWSRVASRVLLQLARFPVHSADDLYAGVRAVRWLDHLGPRHRIAVDFVGTSRVIRDGRFGAMKTKDAVVDHVREHAGGRPSVDLQQPDVRINVHLRKGWAAVSIDLSGEPLHLRSGRIGGAAPLKETLAAALLQIAGWPALAAEGGALVDPFCGSGTFLAEAAGMALDRAPGLGRERWGFTRWGGHDERVWERLVREAGERARAAAREVVLLGCDASQGAIRNAGENARRLGLDEHLRLMVRPLEDLAPPRRLLRSEPPLGLLVANPPYGERLGTREEAEGLYSLLGDLLKQRFPGWTGWILAGHPELAKRVGLKPSERHIIHNGPIECRWLCYPISAAPITGDGPRWRED